MGKLNSRNVSVSVCIVTFNSAKFIEQCLSALNKQTNITFNICIVDNASTDSTCSIIETFLSKQQNISLIRNQYNNGFAGGQNQAIRNSRSNYVLVLNPDVMLGNNYIAELVRVLEKDSLIGSATGQLVYAHDPSIIDSTGLVINFLRQARDRGVGELAEHWMKAGTVFGVSGAASLYARTMIEDISIDGDFFDEQFFAYKEDVDVAWRAQKLGWKAYYEPSAQAIHARGWKQGSRSTIPLFVRQHSYMNRFFTLIKNEEIGLKLLFRLPAIAVYEMLKLAYVLVREPSLLKCLPVFLRQVPDMKFKRKAIHRKVSARRLEKRGQKQIK